MDSKCQISKLCRLCSSEVENGFDIFAESDVKASLVILINKYLPIKVFEDKILPTQICEPCHIGMAACVDLIDRMVEGQHRIRELYEQYLKEEKEKNIEQNYDKEKDRSIAANMPLLDFSESANEIFKIDSENKIEQFESFENSSMNLENMLKITSQKNAEVSQKKETLHPQTLINIQGSSLDVDMDDLAKGKDVHKVYENHPLCNTIGPPERRRRGRPRKTAAETRLPPPVVTEESSIKCRPRRAAVMPARYKDSLGTQELDKVINKPHINNEEDEENEEAEEPGDSIRVSHVTDPLAVLPAAVNIELEFTDPPHQLNDDSLSKSLQPPQVSVSTIEVLKSPSPSLSEQPLRRRGRPRRAKKARFICEFCNMGFYHSGRYSRHIKMHKNVVLQCNECNARYSGNEDIRLHQEATKHDGIGLIETEDNLNIKCPYCADRTFFSLETYKAHVSNMHEGQKPFVCSVCSKRFAYKHSLKLHYYLHKNKLSVGFSCSDCGKAFLHKSSLTYHRATAHNTGRGYACHLCSTNFKHKQLLQRHYIVHSDKRPYVCGVCNSTFKSTGNLYNHRKTHTKEKKYMCNICNKSFHHTTSLKNHLRYHTGEKPHECDVCGKRFVQNGNLVEHRRTHTGEKPFACSLCGKKFTTYSQVSLHEKRHRGDATVRCSVCAKGFATAAALSAHARCHADPAHVDRSKAFLVNVLQQRRQGPISKPSTETGKMTSILPTSITSADSAVTVAISGEAAEATWVVAPNNDQQDTTQGQDIIYILDDQSLRNIFDGGDSGARPTFFAAQPNDAQTQSSSTPRYSIQNAIPSEESGLCVSTSDSSSFGLTSAVTYAMQPNN